MSDTNAESLLDTFRNRELPKDLDAERGLIGALFQNGSLYETIAASIGTHLAKEEFASERHRIIYEAFTKIARDYAGSVKVKTPVSRPAPKDGDPTLSMIPSAEQYIVPPLDFSPIIVCNILRNEGLLDDIGGTNYIASLLNNNSIPESVAIQYANIIRATYKRRQIIDACNKIADICYLPMGRNLKEIFEEAETNITKITSSIATNNPPQPAVALAFKVLLELKNKDSTAMSGIATHFKGLDEITHGLQKGSLNIIAARPAVGKTSFAMNIICNIARDPEVQYPALVFSLEMPAEQLIIRMLATFGGAPLSQIADGSFFADTRNIKQVNQIISGIKDLAKVFPNRKDGSTAKDSALFIDDSSDLSPTELRAKALKLKQEFGGLSVIMIDYIQLMRSSTRQANRTLEIGEISRSLKILAKDLDVPVIALAQLNREVDSRKDHRPLNSDLRESGSIEQDADLIMFLLRESVYNKTEENAAEATLIIGKNRNGATGDIPLTFIGESTKFVDYDPTYRPGGYLNDSSSYQTQAPDPHASVMPSHNTAQHHSSSAGNAPSAPSDDQLAF